MKIRVLRNIKGRDYSSGNLVTNPIQNSLYNDLDSDLAKWWFAMINHQDLNMLADNRKRFSKLFGSPVFHFRSEFDYHCWPIRVREGKRYIDVLLLTAARKGTCYEFIGHRRSNANNSLSVKFLQYLADNLSRVGSSVAGAPRL